MWRWLNQGFTGRKCSVPNAAPTDCPNTATLGASRRTVAANASTTSSRTLNIPIIRNRSKARQRPCRARASALRPSVECWRWRVGTLYFWVKKVHWAWDTMGLLTRQRAVGSLGQGLARIISLDEMWSYVGARRRGKRREVWVWDGGGRGEGRPAVGGLRGGRP